MSGLVGQNYPVATICWLSTGNTVEDNFSDTNCQPREAELRFRFWYTVLREEGC